MYIVGDKETIADSKAETVPVTLRGFQQPKAYPVIDTRVNEVPVGVVQTE